MNEETTKDKEPQNDEAENEELEKEETAAEDGQPEPEGEPEPGDEEGPKHDTPNPQLSERDQKIADKLAKVLAGIGEVLDLLRDGGSEKPE
jgi:hypothetical protein